MIRILTMCLALTTGCAGGSGSAPHASGEETTAAVEAPPVTDATPEVNEPPPADLPTDTPVGEAPDGAACKSGGECQSGICEGEGCGEDQPGTCAPVGRACTRDLRPYCGCDGQTFRTSGACPGRRFEARGPCAGDLPPG